VEKKHRSTEYGARCLAKGGDFAEPVEHSLYEGRNAKSRYTFFYKGLVEYKDEKSFFDDYTRKPKKMDSTSSEKPAVRDVEIREEDSRFLLKQCSRCLREIEELNDDWKAAEEKDRNETGVSYRYEGCSIAEQFVKEYKIRFKLYEEKPSVCTDPECGCTMFYPYPAKNSGYKTDASLHDVRLRGRPTELQVSRHRYRCIKCGRLIGTAPELVNFQTKKNGKVSVRLAYSILYLNLHGFTAQRICEGYGIDANQVSRIKRNAIEYMRRKKEETRRECIEIFNPELQYKEFEFAGEKYQAVFSAENETPELHTLEAIYSVKEMARFKGIRRGDMNFAESMTNFCDFYNRTYDCFWPENNTFVGLGKLRVMLDYAETVYVISRDYENRGVPAEIYEALQEMVEKVYRGIEPYDETKRIRNLCSENEAACADILRALNGIEEAKSKYRKPEEKKYIDYSENVRRSIGEESADIIEKFIDALKSAAERCGCGLQVIRDRLLYFNPAIFDEEDLGDCSRGLDADMNSFYKSRSNIRCLTHLLNEGLLDAKTERTLTCDQPVLPESGKLSCGFERCLRN